jgi:hypothetical protein
VGLLGLHRLEESVNQSERSINGVHVGPLIHGSPIGTSGRPSTRYLGDGPTALKR